jgi:hypothetical protein
LGIDEEEDGSVRGMWWMKKWVWVEAEEEEERKGRRSWLNMDERVLVVRTFWNLLIWI